MEYIGILILIYILITWESLLALPVFIGGVIILIKLRKKRLKKNARIKEEKALKQAQIEQKIKEKVANGEIIYKDLFTYKKNKEYYIKGISRIMTVEEFEELLKKLKKYIEKFEDKKFYSYVDAFGNVFFSYEKYISAAGEHGLHSPVLITDNDYGTKIMREVAIIREILNKEYKDFTDLDISRLLKWDNRRETGNSFVTDINNKNIYRVDLIKPKYIKRSMSYLDEIKELNSKLDSYKDLFGNEIIFKNID